MLSHIEGKNGKRRRIQKQAIGGKKEEVSFWREKELVVGSSYVAISSCVAEFS